ncbi:unnamed protein product [Parascedosporium putredinis]|uniref:Uncharacterized protein n=1 Tax=Parascedosporium putredinis TaxID=1442378 RepID=A0A9P1MBR0_9PEZI|nr:unnamed protein product [Parascedosporium putredinis]CAI7999248.1 unnamed protein product [Parascedosporium putredinis]
MMPSTKRQASKRAAPDREYGSKKRRRDDSTYNREQDRSGGHANIPREELLNEIYALGGDEDDLQLILDVSSQSEHGDTEVPVSVPPLLGAELAELAVTLGLSQAAEAKSERGSINGTAGVKTQAEAPLKLSEVEKKTTFEPIPEWHTVTLPGLPNARSDNTTPHAAVVEALKQHAWLLLDKDSTTYTRSYLATSTHKFLSTIMTSGTMNDKVSALTLAIQESPVHNIRAFEALLNLASKKSRSQAIIALAAIVDLMGPGLLLPQIESCSLSTASLD